MIGGADPAAELKKRRNSSHPFWRVARDNGLREHRKHQNRRQPERREQARKACSQLLAFRHTGTCRHLGGDRFPWVFTLWMSVHRWTLGQEQSFIGFDNYIRLASDVRFWESLWHTLIYTVLSVVAPLFLGALAALVFDAQFPLRGFLRGVFVMPMMATPVAIALVWTMMFHPQLGVLNYLLSFIHIGPLEWIYNQSTVIPRWCWWKRRWTPLVMLIVLGGLAAVPREPYESAEIDGANARQKFRYLTMPMIAPFLMIAVIIRSIDAVKASTSSTR